jgi:hypothetical protein
MENNMNNYLSRILKLLEFIEIKVNYIEISDTQAIIIFQYYQWEEEIIIDFTKKTCEGDIGHSVSCQYKSFNEPLRQIGYHELLRVLYEISLEI